MYCSPDDIEPVIPQDKLESMIGIGNSGNDGSAFTSKLNFYIGLASSDIDSALGGLYQIPIPNTATQTLMILKNICVLLTVGYLYTMNADNKMSEGIGKMIDNARTSLQSYADGGTTSGRLFIPKSLPDAPMQGGPVMVSPDALVPSPDSLTFANSSLSAGR